MNANIKNKSVDSGCPVKTAAKVIDGKWTSLIIRELMTGKKRFKELERGLDGITPKVLTQRLRHLEQSKLITRKAYATIPPTVEYQLTPLGEKMLTVVVAMADFGAELDKKKR